MNHRFITPIVGMFAIIVLFLSFHNEKEAWAADQKVYVIPVEQTVERGLQSFLERAMSEAEENGADHIILEMDTPGGAVEAAGDIASIIEDAPAPTTAYVVEEAMSAGAFISLSADEIAMAPGTEMGAAQVINGSGNAAGDKAQSRWEKVMQNAAEMNGRDPKYALAMADPAVDLPEYRAKEGDLLTLTAAEAKEVNYAEYIAEERDELLAEIGLQEAEIEVAEVTLAEKIARFVTNPMLIPILLSVGSIGLIIELFSPGFGIPGILGLTSLFLFFFGHVIAGFAGFESLILLAAGLVLLLVEIFIPGFGIFGILGIGSVIGSMMLASYSTLNIAVSILAALVLSIIAIIVMVTVFRKQGPMKRFVLQDSVGAEKGFITNETRNDLIGSIGTSLTPLRPSGSVILENERLDVISEGGYIEKGQQVKVVETQGSRIVVRELED